jgi:hypothetical protein
MYYDDMLMSSIEDGTRWCNDTRTVCCGKVKRERESERVCYHDLLECQIRGTRGSGTTTLKSVLWLVSARPVPVPCGARLLLLLCHDSDHTCEAGRSPVG